MNRSAEQTNRVNREAVLVRFVCSALRFISHEPRKKDRSSRDLFVPHCDSFELKSLRSAKLTLTKLVREFFN